MVSNSRFSDWRTKSKDSKQPVWYLIEATFIKKKKKNHGQSRKLNNNAFLYQNFHWKNYIPKYLSIFNKPALTSQWASAIRPATWSRSRRPLDVIFLPLANKNRTVLSIKYMWCYMSMKNSHHMMSPKLT